MAQGILARGATTPIYGLTRPARVPANAQWAGANQPGPNWAGVGGGWWAPPPAPAVKPKSSIGTAVATTRQPPKPKAPAAPKPTYSGTTATTSPPAAPALPTDPRDATYYQNVGVNAKTTADRIAGYQKQQTDAANALPTFDYTNAVAAPQLAHQYGVDVLAQQIAAARRGGLFSSSLAQRIGSVGQNYQNKYTAAQTNYQKLADQIASQILGAQDAQSQYESGQYESAAERASQAAQTNPALGMPTTPLANDQYLIKGGAAAPNYTLTPPKGAPKGAKWSGAAKPPGNWRGIGGGWWAPAGGK